jgi:dienelactone hydrolase
MTGPRFLHGLLLPLLVSVCAAQVPSPRVLDLTAEDGTILKATYFPAGKPGPGVLLLHQCDQQRKIWGELPERMAAKGIHVLAVDYRGFGESGGTPHEKLAPQEAQKIITEKWPGDFEVAYEFLRKQAGVKADVLGAGGASCGVNHAIRLARRHAEVKALMLLSGPTDREGRRFLHDSGVPVFVAAAEDDQYESLPVDMQWLLSVSPNPAGRFQWYATGRHGGEMFGPHPELMDMIADWYVATLMNQPRKLPKTNGERFDAVVTRALEETEENATASEGATRLAEARAKDPKAAIPSEAAVNFLGYEHIQAGDGKGAVEIMKLNVVAHPGSPNAYDSLADAYVADGQKDLAMENAKKALELLASDVKDDEARKKAIRESAEQKLK